MSVHLDVFFVGIYSTMHTFTRIEIRSGKKNAEHTDINLWCSTCQNQIFNTELQLDSVFICGKVRSQKRVCVQRKGAENQVHIKNPAHVWQEPCSNPVSYKCQTMLAVISVEYVSFQTLWEDVCKRDVNKNYSRKLMLHFRYFIYIFFVCSAQSSFGILTCSGLQIPLFLHKHRGITSSSNSDLLPFPLISDRPFN